MRSSSPWCVASAILALVFLAALPAHADWKGKGELGFVMARGNSDTDTGNAKFELTTEGPQWKHAFAFSGLYGSNNSVTSAQRWDVRWQSDYKLSERLFLFGAARYEDDAFSGFDYQATLSAGVGYKFIDTDATKFSGTLGVGYRTLRPELLIKNAAGDVIQRIKGDTADDAIVNAGLDYLHKLTANTQVTNKLLIEAGSENTFVSNDLALQVSMTDKLALSVGYGVRYNSDPPGNLETTDQLTTINLVYLIK